MKILSLLKWSGITEFNLHHIQDAGLNKEIPIQRGKKAYDIGYCSQDGELFMIEIMRIGKRK
ncbi:MAG: hypothetical protein Q8J76_07795 [Desulfobulbaceae bacterium]|nr:hypothetical protein [Desulfobulbaceae bacterium]